MKKIILAILFLLAIGSTYALTIQYTKQTTVQHEVTVGSTVLVQEGLLVTPYNLEQGNLTYFEIEETTTQRHYLTYIYDYEIVNGTYDIQVSSLTNDIVVTSVVIGDRVSVTFALNQDMEFVEGQVLEIGLLFELVEYSETNPFMINQASEKQLQNYFQDLSESVITEMYNDMRTYTITTLTNFYAYTSLSDGDLNHYYQDETYTMKLVFN